MEHAKKEEHATDTDELRVVLLERSKKMPGKPRIKKPRAGGNNWRELLHDDGTDE